VWRAAAALRNFCGAAVFSCKGAASCRDTRKE